MERSSKKSILRCFFIYLALYFGLFLIFYIPNYVIEDYAYLVGDFEYLRFFFARLFEFTLGASSAVVLFVVSVRCGRLAVSEVLASAAVIAVAKIIYSLPYYYLYFLSLGYDSIDGIPLYTLSALLAVFLEWIKMLLLFYVCYFVSGRHITKELISRLPVAQRKKPSKKAKAEIKTEADARLADELLYGGVFNLDAPVTLGVFLVSVGQFIFAVAEEIKNAVDYLVEFAGNYRTGEIIYMTWSFVFILVELVISHIVCHYIKNRLMKAARSKKFTEEAK